LAFFKKNSNLQITVKQKSEHAYAIPHGHYKAEMMHNKHNSYNSPHDFLLALK